MSVGLIWVAAVVVSIAALLAPAAMVWWLGISNDFFTLVAVTLLWLLAISVALLVLVLED